MRIQAFALLLGTVFSFWISAIAATEDVQGTPKLGSGEILEETSFFLDGFVNDTYQIGEEWGKVPVTEEVLRRSPAHYRASAAAVRIGGATGFYLGKFAGVHVVGTNNHVCPSDWRCRGSIRFPVLGKSYGSSGVIKSFPEIDAALVAIEVPARDEELLRGVAGNFAFNRPIVKGQELITVGFGRGNNPRRTLMANFDSDCKVFSEDNEFRFMRDPDSLNPGRDLVWSFANGCDVSHGDSGSSMVDRQTGEVVGIIWTGKIPKSAKVRNSRYLEELLRAPNEETWQELSYAVPAAKIAEVFAQRLERDRLSQRTRRVIRDILDNAAQ